MFYSVCHANSGCFMSAYFGTLAFESLPLPALDVAGLVTLLESAFELALVLALVVSVDGNAKLVVFDMVRGTLYERFY